MKNLVLFLLFLVLLDAGLLQAQSKPRVNQIAELKSHFLKLRNTDPDLEKFSEWRDLAMQFEEFVVNWPKHKEAPSALMNASILYERLYRGNQEKQMLELCVQALQRIARDYPGHVLADDALLRLGDLQSGDLHQKEQALRSYQEIVEGYSDSDMYDVARTRLDQLSGKSPKLTVKTESKEPKGNLAGKAVIVIDPGHGGEDYGAPGYAGLLEKDVVLSIALQLEVLLREELGAAVRLTRRKDVFVPLAERTNLANDFEADLFISLHANSSPQAKLSGVETYYLDNSGDKASLALAERENRSVRFEGPEGDLAYMLSDLIQDAKLSDSVRLAKTIQSNLFSHLRSGWNMGKDLGVKKAPFYVLVGAHMPCVLVEMGFIDSTLDGANFTDQAFRKDMAYALFQGIKQFLADK